MTQTWFANSDDMKYYDTECAAHAAVKKMAPTLGAAEPPLVLCYEG